MTKPTHSNPAVEPSAIQPKLTAEQVLTRLIGLIRQSNSMDEFTPEKLSGTFGVKMQIASPGYYGFSERTSKDWWYSIEVDQQKNSGKKFTLRFSPQDENNVDLLPMTSICQMDFDKFSSELENSGFSKKANYGEHGRLIDYWFIRSQQTPSEITIIVTPQGEHVWNERNGSGRTCIKMIIIH